VCVCGGGEGKAGGVAGGGCFLELLRFVGGVLPTPTQGAHNKNQPTRVPTPPFSYQQQTQQQQETRHNNCLHPFDRVSIQAFFTPLSPIRLPLFFFSNHCFF
jgi:hypothetical protein